MNSIVSIIVPIYNAQDYLRNCIESIINQTYKELEIILVNDGSSDSSLSLCNHYKSLDKRIIVIDKKNSGVANARNCGIRNSNGKYIHFVDADDELESNMIEVLVHLLEKNNADFSICGYKRIMNPSGSNIKTYENIRYSGNIRNYFEDLDVLLKRGLIQGPCWKLFISKIIKDNNLIFPADYSFGEDTVFVYKYLEFCSEISSTNECLYIYNNYRDGGLSNAVRDDKCDLYIYLYTLLYELMYKKGCKINSKLAKSYIGSIIATISEFYQVKPNYPRKKRYQVIKRICTNLNSRKLLSYYNGNEFKYKLTKDLLLLNKYKTLDLLFYLKKRILKQ